MRHYASLHSELLPYYPPSVQLNKIINFSFQKDPIATFTFSQLSVNHKYIGLSVDLVRKNTFISPK